MESSNDRTRMLKRAAREIQSGWVVNLGIGLPQDVIEHLPNDLHVTMHSENGMIGMGEALSYERANPNAIDAGGAYVGLKSWGSYVDSAQSFGMIRGGHIDLTMLGALQVSGKGDLANWAVPGKFMTGAGGAVELAARAKRVVVLTSHTDKSGRSKIVAECTLPLTSMRPVDRIITEKAVFDVVSGNLVLTGLAEGIEIEHVKAVTDAFFQVRENHVTRF